MTEKNKFKIIRRVCYIGFAVGIWRLVEYYYFGDLHRGYALAWATQALVSAPILWWLTKREEKKSKLIWRD